MHDRVTLKLPARSDISSRRVSLSHIAALPSRPSLTGSRLAVAALWFYCNVAGRATWDEDVLFINGMQDRLRPLDDHTRQIRAQIGSLVVC